MARYAPVIVGVLLIVGLTIVQIRMTDRLSGANITAEQKAELLKNVPKNVENWHGEDKPIDEGVRDTAGAIGAVSRTYRNARTGEVVDLWLIVGHGRDIAAHTPDICYPASGFSPRATENSEYPLIVEGQPDVRFLTNTFFREDVTGRRLVRVFWTWFNTENKDSDGKVVWEAPTNSRWHFGNTRALYKMYFTSEMRDPSETAEQSACLRFAREFMPQVEKALGEVYGEGAPAAATPAKDAAETKTEAPAETEEAATETPAATTEEAIVTETGVYEEGPVTETAPAESADAVKE